MRVAGVVAAFVVVVILGTAVPATAAPPTEVVWGDGIPWLMMMPHEGAHGRAKPLYLIGPIDSSAPQSLGGWGFGAHDSVTQVRPPGGASCVVRVIVPGPSGSPDSISVVVDPNLGVPLVRAADIDGDGDLDPLTSVAAIDTAIAQGLVAAFEPQPGGAPIAFTCPVRLLRG